jgi:DNA-binding transcriptional ArsR family regulator
MNIQIDFKASMIKDILSSLAIIENRELFDKELLKILPYTPDKNVEKYLQELCNNKKIDKRKLSFYFHYFYFEEEIFSIVDCLDTEKPKEIAFCTVEEYLKSLRNRSEEQILQSVVSVLAAPLKKRYPDILKEKENIHRDKNKILDLLKSCNISGEAKWNIYMIVSEPKSYMNEFCEFIEEFLPIFNKAYVRLNSLKEEFNNYISARIEKDGIEYLKNLPGFGNVDKYKKVIVSTMAVNYASLIVYDIDDTVYMYMGMEIEKVLEVMQGKSEEEVLLSLLKTISDSSRFNMLKALQNEELFGIELAEKLGLSNATISHHISFLQIANLIVINKRDGKTFYKLNKEPLRNMVKAITKEFNL